MRFFQSICFLFLLSFTLPGLAEERREGIPMSPIGQYIGNGYIIIPAEDSVFFGGTITKESVDALIQSLDQEAAVKDNRWLTIASGGGDIYAAMTLGRYLHRNEMNINVAGICASACAAYILPAGFLKVATSTDDILFHRGSRTTPDQSRQDALFAMESIEQKFSQTGAASVAFDQEYMFAQLQKIRETEIAYFDEIGLNRDFNSCYLAPAILDESRQKNINWWTYPRETLKALGLSNLIIEPSTDVSDTAKQILHVAMLQMPAEHRTVGEVSSTDGSACRLSGILNNWPGEGERWIHPRIDSQFYLYAYFSLFTELLDGVFCTDCTGVEGLPFKKPSYTMSFGDKEKLLISGEVAFYSVHELFDDFGDNHKVLTLDGVALDRDSARLLGISLAKSNQNIEIKQCNKTCTAYLHAPYKGTACGAIRNITPEDLEAALVDKEAYIRAARKGYLATLREWLDSIHANYDISELESLSEKLAQTSLNRYLDEQRELDKKYQQDILSSTCNSPELASQ
ncbi:hypothetical protein PVT68_14220 [Microbulbifer bruguierae]|uniref:Uncharacterized protein n=1 Tax=Microbulbifer bruguierae TaxID=3029061 RepID=A0ABY8NAJ3_9GAMM|nr:hypothetical protein [Microbulbifer bruguierae]WGL15921.1 hypothetical protein PVT68_14220 [Microbulbifer bruguierae]